jgi:hypothetical protein
VAEEQGRHPPQPRGALGHPHGGPKAALAARQAIGQHLRPRYDLLPDSVRQRRSLDDYVAGMLHGVLLTGGLTPIWRYFRNLELSADYSAIT